MRLALLSLLGLLLSTSAAPPSSAAQESHRPGMRSTARVWLVASDRLKISAELYERNEAPTAPFLVLLHDARKGRSEFSDIAPRLANHGYNSIAVDLRAGRVNMRKANYTADGAAKLGRSATILDSEIDIVAALEYARDRHPESKIIAIGCASAGALALRIAGTRPELVDGVAAFSAAEFFEPYGMPATWIEETASSIHCPVFMTSNRSEEKEWAAIFAALASEAKTAFLPEDKDGVHGIDALNLKSGSKDEYWAALLGFLNENFPTSIERRSEEDGAGDAAESSDG